MSSVETVLRYISFLFDDARWLRVVEGNDQVQLTST